MLEVDSPGGQDVEVNSPIASGGLGLGGLFRIGRLSLEVDRMWR